MYLSCRFWAMYRTLRRCCDLTHKRIGGVVVGIERFVLAACGYSSGHTRPGILLSEV